MKNIIIKLLKILGKFILKLLKIFFILPSISYYLGATYDYDTYEKELKKL